MAGAWSLADLRLPVGVFHCEGQRTGHATDCYPRAMPRHYHSAADTINQFYLFNPRCLYQNFIVGVNGGERTLSTYLGPLPARSGQCGGGVYSRILGAMAPPLLNDPDLRRPIGHWHPHFSRRGRHRLFGGGGYSAFSLCSVGYQNRTPIGPAATAP